MTLPRRTFGCSGEVLLTLSIFIATKSPILNLLTLPLDSFIFLLYFCCCPVMYSSVAFFLCGFSGEVPGWSVHKEDCESQWGLSPHVPEIFLLLLDLLLDLLLLSWCGLSHFFVAGVAYKVKQTCYYFLRNSKVGGSYVSLFYPFLYVLWPSELHTVHHESPSLVLHICYLRW